MSVCVLCYVVRCCVVLLVVVLCSVGRVCVFCSFCSLLLPSGYLRGILNAVMLSNL